MFAVMSVTLTRGFSEYYTTLLQALRDDIPNINVYCYNGHMTISGLLLASVRNFVQMNKNLNFIISSLICMDINFSMRIFKSTYIYVYFIQVMYFFIPSLKGRNGKFTQVYIFQISPIVRDIGKLCCNDEMNLLLPDYSIGDFKFFVEMLTLEIFYITNPPSINYHTK